MKLNLKPKVPKSINNSLQSVKKIRVPKEHVKKVVGHIKKIPSFFTPKVRVFIRNFIIAIAIILFLVEAVFAILIYGFKTDNKYTKAVSRYIPFPAVVVNFNAVSYYDYYFERDYIKHFYDQAQKEIPADMNSQIVNQLVDSKLLESNAPKYNVTVSSAEIDQTVNDLIDQNGGQSEVEKVLNDYYGLTLKQFRRLVDSQLLRTKMKDTVPVQVKASHILIKVDKGADQATVDAAKAKADGIYNDIKNGADFADKAKNLSDDTGSRDSGGDLGFFARGDMVKPFEDAAFAAKTGDLIAPVRSDYGWHIIKVTDRKGFVDMSFDDWIKSLRDKSFIKQLIRF